MVYKGIGSMLKSKKYLIFNEGKTVVNPFMDLPRLGLPEQGGAIEMGRPCRV